MFWRNGHSGEVAGIAVSPAGTEAATGGVTFGPRDSDILLWALPSKKLKARLKGHAAGIGSVAWSPDGLLIASGGCPAGSWRKRLEDGSIRVWSAETGMQINEFQGNWSTVYTLQFTPDSTGLIVGTDVSSPGTSCLRYWNLATGKEAPLQGGVDADVWKLALAGDGDTLAYSTLRGSGSKSPPVGTLSLSGRRGPRSLASTLPSAVCFVPGTRQLVAAGAAVEMWDLDSLTVTRTYDSEGLPSVNTIDISKDGRYLACGCGWQEMNYTSHDCRVVILDLWSGKVEAVFPHKSMVISIAYCLGDRAVIAGGFRGGELRVWDTTLLTDTKVDAVGDSRYAVVEKGTSGVDPYPYIYVNPDGGARELHSSERDYLETPFQPGDSERPYVKRNYSQKDGWGDVAGFLKRSDLPKEVVIQPAPAENPSKPLTRSDQIQFLREKGLAVTENPDGTLTVQKPKPIP